MNNNPFDDKINKAVAEAARKVMEQSVAEAKEKEQEDRPDVPFAGPYRDATKPAKDKFGNVIKNRAKSLAKQGMAGVRKEEVEQMDEAFVIHKGKHEPGTKSSLEGTHHGVNVKPVYTDKKEAQTHADKINAGRGYKPGDEKSSLYGGVLYQVSPAKSMKEEVEQIDELSKTTLKSYLGKANKNSETNKNAAIKLLQKGGDPNNMVKASKKLNKAVKRRFGVDAAVDKLAGGAKVMAKEEVEQIAEKAGWRATNVAKKVTNPDGMDSRSYDYHHDNPRSTGMMRATSDTDTPDYDKRRPAQVTTQGPRKGKATRAHIERLKDKIRGKQIYGDKSKPNLPEEFEHMDESKRWNPDGSPKNVGLKAAKKFGKEQDQKTALHHFAKGAAKDDLSKFKKEETSHIAERLTGKQHKIDANKNGKVDAHDFKLLRSKTKKMMKESAQTLMEDTTPALSSAMKAILADAFHMYFKAHTFHWNVEGANFPEYHKFFGDVYEQLFDTIDPIAEEIRALGEYAPRSLTELKGSTSIDDSSVQTPAEMFASLLGDNSKILAGLTNGYKVAESAGEIGLSNFLQDKIDAHKKLGWMIKSVSKGA